MFDLTFTGLTILLPPGEKGRLLVDCARIWLFCFLSTKKPVGKGSKRHLLRHAEALFAEASPMVRHRKATVSVMTGRAVIPPIPAFTPGLRASQRSRGGEKGLELQDVLGCGYFAFRGPARP